MKRSPKIALPEDAHIESAAAIKRALKLLGGGMSTAHKTRIRSDRWYEWSNGVASIPPIAAATLYETLLKEFTIPELRNMNISREIMRPDVFRIIISKRRPKIKAKKLDE